MKLGGRRLVARRHSGVDAGVCGDEYRQIRPGVAGSCIALACDRRRGGGRGVSPPWRRSAGASVTAIVRQSPATIFLKNYLNVVWLPGVARLYTVGARGWHPDRGLSRKRSSTLCVRGGFIDTV